MSYVLWQMVDVHGRWTRMRERKRIGDDDDASLWPRRRRQQIELAIMCLSSCLARASERKKGFSWSSGLALYARTRLRLSLSTPDNNVKKNKNATTNSFSPSFSFLFEVYTCMCGQGPSAGLERWRALFGSLLSYSLYGFYVQRQVRKKERTRKNNI
jgi:hypothetical protein